MKKRLLSLLLLVAVVLSCWTATAAAAYTPKYTAYADALYDLGLFQGAGTLPSGKPDYRLDRTITRAESIVMLLRLLGEADEAATAKDTTPFTDLKGHWAASYIAYAYEKGYTNGTSATTFAPNQAASGKMYLTYLLRALGYDDGAGDFSYNTAHETAAKLGLCAEGAYGSGTFYRDDCVYTSYQALRCRTKGGEALIYRLADAETADGLMQSVEPGLLGTLKGIWRGTVDDHEVEMRIMLEGDTSFVAEYIMDQHTSGTRAISNDLVTFNYTTDRGFVALHEDLMGDHYQFDVVPQWVNGELQLKLSSRLTSETTMLNYFYPDTVTLTKASSSIWN